MEEPKQCCDAAFSCIMKKESTQKEFALICRAKMI